MRILLIDDSRYQECLERAAARFQATGEMQAGERVIEVIRQGSDAIIPVSGPLTYRSDFWTWWFGGTSYEDIRFKLSACVADPNVERVILVFDTPGGEVTGITEAAEAISQCKKPTVAVVDPTCASAGLWLASQCKRIVSVKSGEIGSLGVQAVTASYAQYFADKGIDLKIFRAAISPDKNLGHPYEKRTEKADEYLQTRIDKWGDKFVGAVARGRGVTASEVLSKFGQGRMFEAEDAKDIGLIDEIGSLESVLAEKRLPSGKTKARASHC